MAVTENVMLPAVASVTRTESLSDLDGGDRTREYLARVKSHVRKYTTPNDLRGWQMVGITALCYVLGLAMYPYIRGTPMVWAGVLFSGLINARLGINYHDLAHGSLFKSKATNRLVARVFGALMWISYTGWCQEHHKGHHDHLSRPNRILADDPSATIFFTKQEWEACPPWRKAVLRVIRDPFAFLLIWPTFVFIFGIQNPGKIPGLRKVIPKLPPYTIVREPLIDIILPVLLPALQVWLGCSYGGKGYFWYYLAAKAIGFTIVFMIFQTQHAPPTPNLFFDVKQEEYKLDAAQVFGSTMWPLPPWLAWLTCNVELHTIHHVNAKVPPYRMRECYDEAPPGLWDRAGVIGPVTLFQTLLTSMWDEQRRRFVAFPEYDWLMPTLDDVPQMAKSQVVACQHEE